MTLLIERHRMVVPVRSRTGEEQAGMNKSPPLKGIPQPPTKPHPTKMPELSRDVFLLVKPVAHRRFRGQAASITIERNERPVARSDNTVPIIRDSHEQVDTRNQG